MFLKRLFSKNKKEQEKKGSEDKQEAQESQQGSELQKEASDDIHAIAQQNTVQQAPSVDSEEPVIQSSAINGLIDEQLSTEEELTPAAEMVEQQLTEKEQNLNEQEESTSDKNIQPKPIEKLSFFQRVKRGLSRTSSQLAEGIASLVLGKKEIDDELLEELETQLLMADVGIDASTKIIDILTDKVARKQLSDGDALYQALQIQLTDLLLPVEKELTITAKKPYVILVVGVNGAGKTTTIGKLAKRFQNEGRRVMLAAGDTFRAAAVEQLQVWGERNNVPVIAQHTGADSASVIYDALQSAQAKEIDIVIADTAGRLHNKDNLMDELAKVKRVMGKLDASAPDEVLLVLDAGTGQNALNQAEQFTRSAGVTGIALTKLDGTAKGGVIFALSEKFALPIRFIGIGEGIDDLQPFQAKPFVKALFGQE